MRPKLTKDQISQALDGAVTGEGYEKLADKLKMAPSTIRAVIKEFPLWEYFRDKAKGPSYLRAKRRREARRDV
jgi:hypothetical protein